MGINARSSVDPRWQKWAGTALDGFATAIIAIMDPNTDQASDNYDPRLNGVSAAPTELWRGPSQVAVFRQTLNADAVAGSVTQIRSVRFTIPLSEDLPDVRRGLIVKVLECKTDPQATHFQYTVTSGVNSNLPFRRTIEAEADMGVILAG